MRRFLTRASWALAALVLGIQADAARAQYVQVYSPPTYYAPAVSYYAPPVYAQPVTAYYAPSVSYYAPATSYYAPAVSYYAPAAPVTAYYAPAPVTTYYSPAVNYSYYPSTTVYSAPGYVAPGTITTRNYVGLGIFRPRGVYTQSYYTPGAVVAPTTSFYAPVYWR